MLNSLLKAITLLNPAKLKIKVAYCPLCEKDRPIIKLDDNEIAVRCLVCKASAVSMSIGDVVTREFPDLQALNVYELSARGPFNKHLKAKCKNLITSEFFPDFDSGAIHKGILCQDVQNLTFDDDSFDLCTSTDVFEHVANDRLGFENILRVLKPGGKFIFTVPLYGPTTIERARQRDNGDIQHILAPEYHGDPISDSGQILAFRNYGFDIVNKLDSIGFKNPAIVSPACSNFWGMHRNVIVARK